MFQSAACPSMDPAMAAVGLLPGTVQESLGVRKGPKRRNASTDHGSARPRFRPRETGGLISRARMIPALHPGCRLIIEGHAAAR